jgi:hypothetical protein
MEIPAFDFTVRGIMARSILLLAIALVLLATCAAASSIVQNGGFTSGFLDWTVDTCSVGCSYPGWSVVTGSNPPSGSGTTDAASTGCTFSGCSNPTTGDTISQTLTTVAGQAYTLTFYYDPGSHAGGVEGMTTELGVYWSGTSVDTITGAAVGTWNEYTVTGLTASSVSTALEFTGQAAESYLYLTDISVTPEADPPADPPVPEPASLTLFGGGLLGMGAIGIVRRRRKF